MKLDDQIYVYGFFRNSDGNQISHEVCYPIYIYDFLIDNFVDGEQLFETIDEMEENYQNIEECKLIDLMEYLLLSNEFIQNCRADLESDLLTISVMNYNNKLNKKQINELKKSYKFKITRSKLFNAELKMGI